MRNCLRKSNLVRGAFCRSQNSRRWRIETRAQDRSGQGQLGGAGKNRESWRNGCDSRCAPGEDTRSMPQLQNRRRLVRQKDGDKKSRATNRQIAEEESGAESPVIGCHVSDLTDGFGVFKHGQDTGVAPADSVHAGDHRDRASGRGHQHARRKSRPCLQEWFHSALNNKAGGGVGCVVQFV